MKDKKLFNLNMPKDIYEYLNSESKKNYTTMSQYIIDLILEDKKKYSIYEEMSPPKWFDDVVDGGLKFGGFGDSVDIWKPMKSND